MVVVACCTAPSFAPRATPGKIPITRGTQTLYNRALQAPKKLPNLLKSRRECGRRLPLEVHVLPVSERIRKS